MKVYTIDQLVKVVILAVFASATAGCRLSRNQNGQGAGYASSIYDIQAGSSGQVLDAQSALAEIRKRQGEFPTRVRSLLDGGRFGYMGGYEQHADGSGAEFPTKCGTMIDGREGCYRSGEQRMFSQNGMAQFAPSKDARIDDVLKLSFETIARSLERGRVSSGYYTNIEVRTGASVSGDIGFEKNIQRSNCLHAQGKSDEYRMAFEFWDCGDILLGRNQRKGNLAATKSYWFAKKGSGGSNSSGNSNTMPYNNAGETFSGPVNIE